MSDENDIPQNAEFLRQAFATEQECLVAMLRSSARVTHAGDRGEINEQHFIDFLRKYLPNRYTVEKAIVLDCAGNVSDSIDVVVFDRQYTPALLDNDKHRYVPAEAVYAIFECKPRLTKAIWNTRLKKPPLCVDSKRRLVEIHHAGGKYPPRKLNDIVAGILAIEVGWKDGFGSEAFRDFHAGLNEDKSVDCGFAATGACFDTFAEAKAYTFGPPNNWALAFFGVRVAFETSISCHSSCRGLDGLRKSTQRITRGKITMYDYSERIDAFRDEKVRLSSDFTEKLLAHRKANRDRLIIRLPDFIKGVTIGE